MTIVNSVLKDWRSDEDFVTLFFLSLVDFLLNFMIFLNDSDKEKYSIIHMAPAERCSIANTASPHH